MGDKVYWTCRDHALHGCRSRAITQGQKVTVMRGHCHPPDMEGLQARRQQEKNMQTLKARPTGPGGCTDKLLQGRDSLICHQGPGDPPLTSTRPRRKAKITGQELSAQTQAPQEEDQDTDPGEPSSLGTCCSRAGLASGPAEGSGGTCLPSHPGLFSLIPTFWPCPSLTASPTPPRRP